MSNWQLFKLDLNLIFRSFRTNILLYNANEFFFFGIAESMLPAELVNNLLEIVTLSDYQVIFLGRQDLDFCLK